MFGIALVTAVLIGFGKASGIRISTTDSAAPAGVYRIAGHSVRRGELVAACLPIPIARFGLARGYLRAGDCPGNAEPVDKLVGALPGDVLDIERGWVSVNGVRFPDSRTASHDSAGRPLAHVAWGKRRVGPGEVWLFGFNDRRSWDSRYFGPVPLGNIRGELRPVVTW
ncbi:MAG TPA: conjugative transfer signal peptidase TraF [Candidatus Binataceae bacterium]|jgi:conjugative transfer signal peptidase TraF|nr:conjugative transfer signal peptidase TraF [Candidatus Binataceae bacterium]